MSSKYVFTKIKDEDNPHSISNVYMEIETESLANLQEEFECFLKACGFVWGESDD